LGFTRLFFSFVRLSHFLQIVINVPAFKLHRLTSGPGPTIETTAEEMVALYRQMQLIRRVEVACDQLYKQRLIRGFLHLYNGQEAVVVGMEAAITRDDHVITAYRDHGFQLVRGDTPERVFAELLGKDAGCSRGKGGSMHMYLASSNFWGGNGIVGAQVPVGAGLALALQYKKKENVSLSFYGDGAANQGQIFETYNMAKLWNLPALFICENNHYGMGTSTKRASAAGDTFYTRGDYVPGLWVDGMDVYASKAAFGWAKQFALKNGPLVMEMETYRYVGHSMSDPGISYRSKEEVASVREKRDPILKHRARMLEHGAATEDELAAIDKEIKNQVDAAVKFATEAPMPDRKELFTDVFSTPSFVRGRSLHEHN
jgi:pyruvate dehydrogenase E1 component alpha subunit